MCYAQARIAIEHCRYPVLHDLLVRVDIRAGFGGGGVISGDISS